MMTLLTSIALAGPLDVDLGAQLDANHAQGVGLSRIGVGLDVTVRGPHFGFEASYVEAVYRAGVPLWTDPNSAWAQAPGPWPDASDSAARRTLAMSAVWSPLWGDVAGVPLTIDLSGGFGIVQTTGEFVVVDVGPFEPLERVRSPSSFRPTVVFAGGGRLATGRYGSLRLRTRLTAWIDDEPQWDPTVLVNRKQLYTLVTPEIGWVVRL